MYTEVMNRPQLREDSCLLRKVGGTKQAEMEHRRCSQKCDETGMDGDRSGHRWDKGQQPGKAQEFGFYSGNDASLPKLLRWVAALWFG